MKRIPGILFLVALLFAAFGAEARAQEIGRFYVSSASGSDRADGLSPENAVKTLAQACRIAERSGVGKAYIVLTDVCTASSTVTEAAHKVPFVLTTDDGKTDYGARGAKLVFGKGLRYVLNGDTSFEKIAVEYSGTLNFVAQYHRIVFGEGVTHIRLDGDACGVYLVGGWQSPGAGKTVDADSYITIGSGSFAYVVGGSRQGTDLTFTGTHHITVSGGTVKTLYAGTMSKHTAGRVEIRVTGGQIDTLCLAGDGERALNGNADARLSGGEIGEVLVNNVIGDAAVFLCGAQVDRMEVSFASSALETAHRKAGSISRLSYSGAYGPLLERYVGFSLMENATVWYAGENASGDGASEETPASFETAFSKAAETGGAVKIVGCVRLGDYREPAHGEPVVVTGASGDAVLRLDGVYTLAGETRFESLTLTGGGTFDAQNGLFSAAETAKTAEESLSLAGSAVLCGGTFSEIRDAGTVVVEGGRVKGAITGGGEETHITLLGGSVGTVRTAGESVRVFSLSLFGGSADTVIFSNVTEELSLRLAGGTVLTYKTEENCVKGKLYANAGALDSLSQAASLFEKAEDAVFFLRDEGIGDGSGPNTPSASLDDAYAALGERGGTLVICGPFTVRTAVKNLKNDKPVVITSRYEGIDYAQTAGARMIFSASFLCGGETEFREITLAADAENVRIFGNCRKLTLGEGIVSVCHASSGSYLSLTGGKPSSFSGGSVDLTVRSGVWKKVTGAAENAGTNVTVSLTVTGGTFTDYVTLGSAASHSGDIRAVITGGTFYQGIYASTLTKAEQSFGAAVSLQIGGGTFYGNIAAAMRSVGQYTGSYAGSFDVEITGGDFAHLTELIGESGHTGSMTSSLKLADTIDPNAPFVGKTSFTNPVKVKSDPWLFYHDGYYYLTGSAAYGTSIVKAPNIGDLQYALYEKVYSSTIKSNWSAEIHHYTDEEIGEGNGGWYCYIASPEDGTENATRRMYTVKCLDGDDLMGRWGDPVTGEVNKPRRVTAPDVADSGSWWGAGQSDIRIGGKVYALFVSEVGRETADFHQTINIMEMENPWTLRGQPSVICVPEYDWEKHGYSYNPNAAGKKAYPAVVEGATALYGEDGTVFLTYTGSGVWTTEYQLGYMTYLGGDPLDANNWQKNPTSILYKSNEVNGTGHGSFVTDTAGQIWICYHAYRGTTTGGSRYAIAEPVRADKNGVVIGNGSGIAAPLDTVYEVALNPLPLDKRIRGFDSVSGGKAAAVPDEPSDSSGAGTAGSGRLPGLLFAALGGLILAALCLFRFRKRKQHGKTQEKQP
ncbi:MAG: family 43 glycosylhydrolase [Clostridia bacterium]|nr:family 43 glycosylhydrolase [Clostridia bacterium]